MNADNKSKTAYVPIVAPGDPGPSKSKYFGRPWFATGEVWPTYGGVPMVFVLQLAAAELPLEAQEMLPANAVVQLFYALDGDWPDDDDISKMAYVRAVFPNEGKGQQHAQPPIAEGDWNPSWVPLSISGWEPKQDEYWDANEQFGDDDTAQCLQGDELLGDALFGDDEGAEDDDTVQCLQGDKLLGNEFAAQGFQTPLDSLGQPMAYLYQIDAGCFGEGPAVPAYAQSLFAGDGTGHIFVSRTNQLELKFTWACS